MPSRHRARKPPPGEPEFCHYCNKEIKNRRDRTIDHIVPKSLRGVDAQFNYVVSCRTCNTAKSNEWPTCRCRKCRKSVRIHWEQFRIRKPKD